MTEINKIQQKKHTSSKIFAFIGEYTCYRFVRIYQQLESCLGECISSLTAVCEKGNGVSKF